MPRKTDAELLEELEETKKELAKAKKEVGGETEEYTAEPVDSDDEDDVSTKKPQVQIAEREITLSLINDKLNFIISKVQSLE